MTARSARHRRPYQAWLESGALLVAVILAFAGVSLLGRMMATESTDDAFIEAHVITISPQVAGRVAAVHVKDNESVSAGQVLVEIDPRDYDAELAKARAAAAVTSARKQLAESDLAQARAHLASIRADAAAAEADTRAAQAEATRTSADAVRGTELYRKKAIAREELDHLRAADVAAQAALAAARQKQSSKEALVAEASQEVDAAQAQIALASAQGDEAAAAVQQAELNVSYTSIRAPEDGRVTVRSVEPGAYVSVGQALLALVPQHVWVVANYKETQLTHMRPGQPADVAVDAYPDLRFSGHVDSIQAGTGARFSLLPAENASGNYIKVVQRLPVKIVFDTPRDDEVLLAPGMSVVPVVTVRPYPTGLVTAADVAIVVAAVAAFIWMRRRRPSARPTVVPDRSQAARQ